MIVRVCIYNTFVTIKHTLVVILNQALARLEIRLHHLIDKRIKIHLTLPAKYFLGLSRPSQELSVG